MDNFNYPAALKLFEQYPIIKKRYINLITSSQDNLNQAKVGSKHHLYLIPNHLERCKSSLESLKKHRALDIYNEAYHSPVLNDIEEELEELIEDLTQQTKLHNCNIKGLLKDHLIAYFQLAEQRGEDYSEVKDDLINLLSIKINY